MTATSPTPSAVAVVSQVYDDFSAPGGYTLADYASRWSNPFGPGEMGLQDTRAFVDGEVHLSAVPFRTAADESVFDHLKYMACSTATFPVPSTGSVLFTTTMTAQTPGADGGRIIHGTYLRSGRPYQAAALQGQQAGAVMNVVDFATGQLFDWFLAGDTAFALIERLPSVVTGNTTDPHSPEFVGTDKMYTQIIAEFPVGAGRHEVGIRFSRNTTTGSADWYLDGAAVAHVDHVGIPLDRQGVDYTGTYPSLGPGEEVAPKLDSLAVAHGLFSMLDAFPFGHPDAPDEAVSIPLEERRWGQGVAATFGAFRVETLTA